MSENNLGFNLDGRYRFVKVETTKPLSTEEVVQQMYLNSKEGLVPKWDEILDSDTVELNTETLFDGLYQTTIPLPVDSFPFLKKITADQAGMYCVAICQREKWKQDYKHFMAVLNNLDMEM